MGLEKSIEKGWERRKKYRGSKVFDHSCRNNEKCSYCRDNRLYNTLKKLQSFHYPEKYE